MLYNVVNPDNDRAFAKFAEHVRLAYWPEKYEHDSGIVKILSRIPPGLSEEDLLRKLKDARRKIVNRVCSGKPGLYTITLGGGGNKASKQPLSPPFMDCFHRLFLQRQYEILYNDPGRDASNILSLFPKKQNNNYSRHRGNYHHFVNVVMATARLIGYFKSHENVIRLFDSDEKPGDEAFNDLDSVLSYKSEPCVRTFKLMLAAFYHDIGKTVVDHRHGMEGSFIIADHTTRSLSQIDAILKSYPRDGKWDREDLLDISHYLYYHDAFGTFGTGEASFTLLPEIIDRMKRSSLNHSHDSDQRKRFCKRLLFDLWVLNIADIIVSRPPLKKLEPQKDTFWGTEKNAVKVIEEFLDGDGGKNRIHDLRVAMRLLHKHNEGTHKDDTHELERIAQEESRAHTVERIKRLVVASMESATVKLQSGKPGFGRSEIWIDLLSKMFKERPGDDTPWLAPEVNPELSSGVVHNVIFRSIQSLNDPAEFYKRLSWIVVMDYSLGFFTKIAQRALELVSDELHSSKSPATGWIRSVRPGEKEQVKSEYVQEANAIFFLDNYCATVVKILAHLLFRERSIDQPSNIEFEDASERLTEEKIEKIIGMEGPYRQNRTVAVILKTVFVY
ncbi:MAG: hypothetical protein ABSB96_06885 [Gaiellaceae bacterium]